MISVSESDTYDLYNLTNNKKDDIILLNNNYIILSSTSVILLVICSQILMFLGIKSGEILFNGLSFTTLGFILLCFAFIPIIILTLLANYTSRLHKSIFKSIISSNTRIINLVTDNESNFDEILLVTDELHENLNKLEKSKKFFLNVLNHKGIDSTLRFESTQINGTLRILKLLHTQLITAIKIQQQSLEQAKSEVEKNITGTTELNQVSELQRARLDKQIEQFEELQRVLVRV